MVHPSPQTFSFESSLWLSFWVFILLCLQSGALGELQKSSYESCHTESRGSRKLFLLPLLHFHSFEPTNCTSLENMIKSNWVFGSKENIFLANKVIFHKNLYFFSHSSNCLLFFIVVQTTYSLLLRQFLRPSLTSRSCMFYSVCESTDFQHYTTHTISLANLAHEYAERDQKVSLVRYAGPLRMKPLTSLQRTNYLPVFPFAPFFFL